MYFMPEAVASLGLVQLIGGVPEVRCRSLGHPPIRIRFAHLGSRRKKVGGFMGVVASAPVGKKTRGMTGRKVIE